MSQCYSIACTQCEEALWVAQSGIGSDTFYSGEPETMRRLGKFLFAHAGHPLVFGDDNRFVHYRQVHWEDEENLESLKAPAKRAL